MAFVPGQIVYHDYGEVPRVVHTRIILGHISGHEYLIRTPDGDEYCEVCDSSNGDLSHFFVGPDDGSLPAGIPAGSVYGFGALTVAEFNAMLAAGRLAAAAERGRRGIQDVGVPLADNQMVWVLAEMVKGHSIGERVIPPAAHPKDGTWGLMQMADSEGHSRPVLIHQLQVDGIPQFCEDRISLARSSVASEGDDRQAGEDARTMEVKYAASGERQRSFKDTVAEFQQTEFEDFPLEPRTSLAYLKAVSSIAESSFGQHLSWVHQSRIPENDRAIHESEVLSRAIDMAICYDQLNVVNLASFELLIRRKQLLAEAYSYGGGTPSYAGSDHFMGTSYRPGGAIVVPELTRHVADRMHQESQILKEKRKQQEMKGGKGKKDPPPPKPGKQAGGRWYLGVPSWPLWTGRASICFFSVLHVTSFQQQDFS